MWWTKLNWVVLNERGRLTWGCEPGTRLFWLSARPRKVYPRRGGPGRLSVTQKMARLGRGERAGGLASDGGNIRYSVGSCRYSKLELRRPYGGGGKTERASRRKEMEKNSLCSLKNRAQKTTQVGGVARMTALGRRGSI